MDPNVWLVLWYSIWESNEYGIFRALPGTSLDDWLGIRDKDYDDVDRFLIDLETIGG